ncbi:hypothetical protein JCGZ_06580 [Jatropha curcas]|uniref:Uncharacterized protein n=1 Tax=Jatropha curcas TaxID=180498 RepID=A0A067LNL4_JATCU|nr:hypothetical protein JCGZ_06580 [Jatropha curcas]
MEHAGRNHKSGGERGDCRAHFGHLENRSRKTNAKNELLGKNRARWRGERSVLSGHHFPATVHGGWRRRSDDRPTTLRRGPERQKSLLFALIMESLPDSQLVFIRGSNAILPAELYWESMLPNTPLPNALQELLEPAG